MTVEREEREAIPEDSHSGPDSDDKQRKLQFTVDILDNFLSNNINIQQARKSDKTNNFPKLDFQAYKSLKCAAKPAVNVGPNTLSSLSH